MNYLSMPIRLLIPGILLAVALLFAPAFRNLHGPNPTSDQFMIVYLLGAIGGLILAVFGIIVLGYLTMWLSSRTFGIARIGFGPKLTVSHAVAHRWTLHSPTQGLTSPTLFLIPGTVDPSLRRRYMATLAFPLVSFLSMGVLAYFLAYTVTSETWVVGLMAGVAVCFSTVAIDLIPYRTESCTTVGGVLRMLSRQPESYPTFVEHNILAVSEFGLADRPRNYSQELVAGIYDDLTEECLTPDTKIAAARLLYLVAIDRREWVLAGQYIQHLHHAIQDPDVLPNNRRAIELLFAFHAAWVEHNWSAARVWLNHIGTDRALRKTPMYLITDALIARLKGDVHLAAKRLKTADKRTRAFRVVAGTTRFWLEVIDSAYLSLPFDLQPRGKRRTVTPLVRLPNPEPTTDQPQAA